MKSFAFSVALLSVALSGAAHAQAQQTPEVKALGECLVEKSTGGDRISLMRWMTTSILAAPQLADIAKIPAANQEKADRSVAAIWMRLLTIDCVGQTQAVMKGGGGSYGMRIAGETLGRVAMQELMNNPQTVQAMTGFTRYLNTEQLKKIVPAK